MRVAAIYDIHGNLPALEAVIADVLRVGVEQIVVGGDVFPGPMPCETMQRLLELDTPTQYICGNGDREVLAQMKGEETEWYRSAPEQWQEPVRWTAHQLKPKMEGLLAGWPKTLRMEIDGLGEVLFCHATPRNDTECFTKLTAEVRLLPVLEGVDARLVVCGHTHMQFDRTVGMTRVVNAGSVGMPFGEPGAYWLLLDGGVQLRRTSYDFAKAAGRIRATPYPQAQTFAEHNVVQPPSEEKMLETFSRAELK
jgi:predicted phosphodiesterase